MNATATAERQPQQQLPATDVVPKAPLSAGGRVMALIPQTLDEVYRVAKWIAAANWAPKSYLDKDGIADETKIAVGIMHGLEVGLTPLAALQSIAVINGMPTVWGDGALAIIQASGLLEDFTEEAIKDAKGATLGYRCTMKRRGRKGPRQTEFVHADAQRAGLLTKSGPWQQYTPRMYQMRARAWCMRDEFTDVLRGLAIREEVEDMVDVTTRGSHDIAPAAQQPRTAAAALDRFAAPVRAEPTESKATDAVAATAPWEDEGGDAPGGDQGQGDNGNAGEGNHLEPEPDPGPEMPQEMLAAWMERQAWLTGWKWIAGVLSDGTLSTAVKQVVVKRYLPIVDAVMAHSDAYRKAAHDLMRGAGVEYVGDQAGSTGK